MPKRADMTDQHGSCEITGTCGESLSVILTTQHPEYTSVSAYLELPNAVCPFRQEVSTVSYCLPDIAQLDALLNGTSNAVFEFTSLSLTWRIGEHTWGARSAYLVTGEITTIQHANFSPWPAGHSIGDFILDDNPNAACLNFAFRTDHERLQAFRDHLCLSLKAIQSAVNHD